MYGCEDSGPSDPHQKDNPTDTTQDITQDITLEVSSTIESPWYYQGDTLQLQWTASSDPEEGFEVLLSIDTGTTYSTVTPTVLPPDTRNYKYVVTEDVVPRALLKIHAQNGGKPAEAVSDTFTQNKFIRITNNLAGKVFSHEDDIEVEWVADTGRVTNGFLVDISWNMGADFRSVIMDESLDMDVTSAIVLFKTDDSGDPINSDQCILRVHEYDHKENYDITGPFTLRP